MSDLAARRAEKVAQLREQLGRKWCLHPRATRNYLCAEGGSRVLNDWMQRRLLRRVAKPS